MAELIYKRNTKKSKKNTVITASAVITLPGAIQHTEQYVIRKSACAAALSK